MIKLAKNLNVWQFVASWLLLATHAAVLKDLLDNYLSFRFVYSLIFLVDVLFAAQSKHVLQ